MYSYDPTATCCHFRALLLMACFVRLDQIPATRTSYSSNGSRPCWALPYSSAALSAADPDRPLSLVNSDIMFPMASINYTYL